MNKKLLSALLVISSLAPVAQAATTPLETYDSGQMPLCILRADGQQFIRFEWNQDPYQRDVYVETSPRTGFAPGSGSQIVDLFQALCQNPDRQYDSSTSVSATRQKLAAGQKSVMGYEISAADSVLLAQVTLGGNVARTGNDADQAQYYAAHPIRNYTTELNREITAKYGMGFSSQMYKDYIESQPKNAAIKARVETYIAQSAKGALSVAERFKGYTFAIVRGYAFTVGNNARYEAMTQDLINAGLSVKVLDNTPFGSIEGNRAIVLKEIEALIASGQKVILVPASKGGPEALGAIADLAAANNGDASAVAAVVSLSSMIDGSFVVDFAGSPLVWPFAKKELFKEFNEQGGQLNSDSELNPMLDMETKKIAGYYVAHPFMRVMPVTSPVYVNLVGTPLGNGLVKDPSVLEIQDSVIRAHLSKSAGGSDGYIEFPGTEIPESAGVKTYTLAFNASHAILDGDFEGHTMSEDASMTTVLVSILNSLADILSGSL